MDRNSPSVAAARSANQIPHRLARSLLSGQVRLAGMTDADLWRPEMPAYLVMRGVDVADGAWRAANDQSVATGQVVRSDRLG